MSLTVKRIAKLITPGRYLDERGLYALMNVFMADLRKREGTAARALEFTILTAARTGEVIGALSALAVISRIGVT
jgi:hypothetical protein